MTPPVVIAAAEVTTSHRRLASRLGWASVLSMAIPCIGSMAMAGVLAPIAPLLIIVFGCAPLLALAALIAGWRTRTRDATVTIGSDGVRIESIRGTRGFRLDEIVHGWHLPGFPDRVEWALRDGRVQQITVTDEAEAVRALAASGVDVRHRAISVKLGTAAGLFALGALGFVVSICPATIIVSALEKTALGFEGAHGAVWLAIVASGIAGTIALLAPPRVTIGADGIAIARPIGTRFIPFGEVTAIRNDVLEIVIHLRNGHPVRLPLADVPLEQRRALFRRLEDARIATLRGVDAASATELLARRGRSLSAWREALIELLRGGASYRASALRREDVTAVLDDPNATAEARLGAAIALTAEGENDARERVRVAAMACASEKLRVALEHVADDVVEADDVSNIAAVDETRTRR